MKISVFNFNRLAAKGTQRRSHDSTSVAQKDELDLKLMKLLTDYESFSDFWILYFTVLLIEAIKKGQIQTMSLFSNLI